MQCLAMVVISAFIGAKGLGIDLLFRLQTLQLGRALESGIAIVLMAVALDRLSQALSEKEPEHKPTGAFWIVHPYLTIAGLAIVVGSVLAYLVPEAGTLPRGMTITLAPQWDFIIKAIVSALFEPLSLIREYLPPYFLIPIRGFFEQLPWTVFLGAVSLTGWLLGGWALGDTRGLLYRVHRAFRLVDRGNDNHIPCLRCCHYMRDFRVSSRCLGIASR